MRALTSGLLVLGTAAALVPGCSPGTLSVRDTSQSLVSVGEDPVEKKEAKQEKAGAPFALPSDRGGKLLAAVLPPRQVPGTLRYADRATPAAVPAPRFVEPPPTLPRGTAVVARATVPARKDVLRPRLVLDEGFDGTPGSPALPATPSFAADKPVSVPAEDVSIPAAMPILSQPSVDRIPIDDFTLGASTAAVLSAALPRREKPAPFVREAVPEPFKNRKPLPTKAGDEEPTAPVADGPALPKK